MKRTACLVAGVLSVAAAFGSPYGTVIRGALIKERLDAKAVRELKAAGVGGVEMNLMTKTLPTLDEARATRALAEAEGLAITSTLGGWFAFNEPENCAAEIEKAKRCIEITKAYGAPVMLIVPVGFYPDNGPKFPPFREIAYRWDPATLEVSAVTKGDNAPYADYIRRQNAATAAAVKAVRELLPLAAEKGVVLALENVGSRMWMKPDYHHALVKGFRSPWVKFYFDMGNSINVGDPCEWIDEFGADIVRVHLKDDVYDANRPWGQRMVPIGEGVLDFRRIREALDRINYNGWVAVESDFRSDADHGKILRRFCAGEPVWPGNLLRNPDFSVDNGIGLPLAWTTYRQSQADGVSADSRGPGEFRFTARGRRRVFLQQGGLTLVPDGRYRIAADVRTAGNGNDAIRFLVRNRDWNREPATPFLPADTTGRWVRVSSVIVAPPNTAKDGYVFAIEGCGGTAGEASADIRGLTLEACDAAVADASRPMPEADCRVLPARIVPIDPLLARVDAASGRMMFYWPGAPACGRAACTLAGRCDGGADVREARFGEDGTAELSFGRLCAGDHRVTLEVRAPDGATLATNAYVITAGTWKDPAKTGRRLNNLVTELVNGPLTDGDRTFVRAEPGWVWISFDGDCGDAEGFLDGSPEPAVRRRTGERHLETQRFVSAGGHVLTVRGAKGGRLRIHAVKSIWGNPIGNLTAKRCNFETDYLRYSLPFARRFALLSTFNTFPSGSWFFKDDLVTLGGFYFDRGFHMLNSVHFGPYDARRRDPEATRRILSSGMGENGYPTCVDENVVVCDHDSAVNFAEAVWRLSEERPLKAFDVFYADTSSGVTFTDPRKSASEIAAVVNSGRGLGLLCPELYLPVLDNARSLDEYVDSCAELMASSERFVPASRGKMVLYTAGYVAIGDWSNYVSPKADVKVHFSDLIRAFATDPRFAGCAGVAFSGLVCCEEEFRRWGTQVIRHYALEGATDDLAARYGYAWAPGLVRDPDFEEGLSAWTVRPAEEGSVYAERLPRYGDYFQRRICIGREYKGHLVLPKGFGDTVATFRSSAAGANEVSQRITGLEPGRHYALLAVVADKKTLTTGTADAKKLPPFAFSARMEGADEVRGLRFVNSRRGEWKPKGAANKAVMYNLRYVFRAEASEATLVFSDRGDDGAALEPGTELSLNYVILRPYHCETPEEIPEIVSALGWDRSE